MENNKEQLIKLVESMNVLELSEAVKELESIFGVSPATASAANNSGAAPQAAVEEKTSFDLVLKSIGATKINVIRVVNKIVEGGLKEAKDVVEGALPRTLKENLPKNEAEDLKKQLQEAGAEVELQ